MVKIPFFLKKNLLKKKKLIQESAKDFLLSHFEYCQIWLNVLMDNLHKLNGKKKNKKNS